MPSLAQAWGPARLAPVGPRVLLSFDLEECDIPLEYGHSLTLEEQLALTTAGLESLLPLLDRLGIESTFFTTASFALAHPTLTRQIAGRHEIASHGVQHSHLADGDLLRSRRVLESLLDRPVRGFRMARMAPVDRDLVRAAGYEYCSSENPTWLPGRYNYLRSPRTVHVRDGLVQVPASVTPWGRLPLFWLTVKNLPAPLVRRLCHWTLRHDGYLSLYFHPWEFADLRGLRLPWYVARRDGVAMLQCLESLLGSLARPAGFITFWEFVCQFQALQDSLG